MSKTTVVVRNPEVFQQFLVKYIEDGNTNKIARWKGVPARDQLKIIRLKFTSNVGRPQIIGTYQYHSNGNKELTLSIRLHTQVYYLLGFVSLFFFLLTIVRGLFPALIVMFIAGIWTALPVILGFLYERPKARFDVEVLSQIAKCETLEEMEELLPND